VSGCDGRPAYNHTRWSAGGLLTLPTAHTSLTALAWRDARDVMTTAVAVATLYVERVSIGPAPDGSPVHPCEVLAGNVDSNKAASQNS